MKTTISCSRGSVAAAAAAAAAEERRRRRRQGTAAPSARPSSNAFIVGGITSPSSLLPPPLLFPASRLHNGRLATIAALSSSSCSSSAADATATVNGRVEEEKEEEDRPLIIKSTSTSTTSTSSSSSSPSVSAAALASASSPLNSPFLNAAARKQWKKFALAGCCLLFCTACNLSSPVLAGRIFDSLISEASAAAAVAGKAVTTPTTSSAFLPSLAVLAFTYTAEPLVTRIYISTAVDAAEAVLASARVELFRCLLSKKISFFDASPPLALARAAADDLDALRSVALASTARDRGPRAVLEAAGAVAVLAWLSWRLGPVLALVIGATAAAAALHRLRTKPLEAAAASAAQEMHSVAARALGAMPTVRSFGAERSELLRFSKAALASAEAARGFGRAKGQLEAMSRGAVHASLLLLYGLGGLLVRRSLLPAGVLLSAVGFTYSLVYATQGAVQSLADLRRAGAALARVRAAAAGEGLGGRETSAPSPLRPREGGVDWKALAAPDPSVLSTLPSSEECLAEAADEEDEELETRGGGGRRRSREASASAATATTAAPRIHSSSPSTSDRLLLPLADICFKNVSFSYPTRPSVPVLRGLNLELKAGSVTALVGASGERVFTLSFVFSFARKTRGRGGERKKLTPPPLSLTHSNLVHFVFARAGAGKSTVASLLARFYDPSGTITHGGVDLREVPFKSWTRSVALVPQEIALFDGTVAENISFGFSSDSGSDSASMDAIVAAAKAARAHDFISALPGGYAARVGRGAAGSSLSGGQRQRIAIARALLKDAPVVVLDEHTSSLDGPAAAEASAEALRALLNGRTVLVIAHSLATIMAADNIAVVEGGTVVESGTHSELVRVQRGAYSRLVDAQALILG